MSGRWTMALALLAAIALGPPVAGAGPGGPGAVEPANGRPVESFAVVPVDSLNARVLAAQRSGQDWTKDPLRLAVEVLDLSALETRSVELRYEADRGEGADSAWVTVVSDGWRDDSVRGTWQRLRIARQEDGTWRLVELRQAWRCWRGHHRESYSKQPCL